MKITAVSVGSSYPAHNQSGITELSLADSGLRVVVCRYPREAEEHLHVEYFFTEHRGFRLLDEGDLLHYWKNGSFPAGQHLFEISAGGWLAQELETPGAFSVTNAAGSYKEYFIRSTDLCLSVLSRVPPRVRDLA